MRTQQHRRGPADGEDPQDQPEGGAVMRQVKGGDRFACQLSGAAQPDKEDGGQHGITKIATTKGRDRRVEFRGREEVQDVEEVGRERVVGGR